MGVAFGSYKAVARRLRDKRSRCGEILKNNRKK
jgi:hypothetical protein